MLVLDENAKKLMACRHHDPFSVLGRKQNGNTATLKVFRPDCEQVFLLSGAESIPLERIEQTDYFFWQGAESLCPTIPRLRVVKKNGDERSYFDPYSFQPFCSLSSLQDFSQQDFYLAHELLGARQITHQGINGILFSVWAPNAERVSVVGDFNQWNGAIHPMRCLGDSGVWELFLTGIDAESYYQFEIRNRYSGEVALKSDPYGRAFALRPNTASRLKPEAEFHWQDQHWLARRRQDKWLNQAMSIYEVHLGSWRRDSQTGFLNYRDLAHALVDYVKQLGFTHIQLLPISEHPYDASWGYQVTGYFAPTSRFGNVNDFKYFVDYCHRQGIGVILDWVPAHFPRDAHGLRCFDGQPLYEHEDPLRAEHKDWGTLIFDYGRNEVKNFLLSSAYFWLQEFHIDGLRVDAVASMLYLDYSRQPGEWRANKYGGNENLEAIQFIKKLNTLLHDKFPGALVIAEESTSWPGVSRPVYTGGLGFSMKWNMGWMNDSLDYFSKETIYRAYHHEHLTFGLLYAFSENFVLPLSHDEVVHEKRSILNKMPGDAWQKFANVRLLYTYMFTYPGKKLLFMGDEFAQGEEWNHDQSLPWHLLEHDFQQGVQLLVRDLNALYRGENALHGFDFEQQGFQWVDCHDHQQSVISYLRRDGQNFLLIVLNFTPTVRHDYCVGVPESGIYGEILSSDSCYYQGSDVSNGREIKADGEALMGFDYRLQLTLPPLAGVVIKKLAD